MSIRKFDDAWSVRRQISKRGLSKSDALRYAALLDSGLADIDRRFKEKAVPCCSIRGKLNAFLEDSRAGLGRRKAGFKTRERHRRRLRAFDRFFKGQPLDAISRERLERWIHLRRREVCADTVNADLNSLRAFARWAQRKGEAPALLPILTVDKLYTTGKLAGKNRKPPKAREIGELIRIVRSLKEERQDIGVFLFGMILFGLRPANVWQLRRQDATLPRGGDVGRLYVIGLKGEPDRDIPVPAGSLREEWVCECLALGRQVKLVKPHQPLVPCFGGKSRSNRGGWTTGSFCMALRRLMGKMEIAFTAYQVRHSCASWLQTREGIALANVQGYAGHTRIDTQNAYSHRHGKEAEPAYHELEEILRNT